MVKKIESMAIKDSALYFDWGIYSTTLSIWECVATSFITKTEKINLADTLESLHAERTVPKNRIIKTQSMTFYQG